MKTMTEKLKVAINTLVYTGWIDANNEEENENVLELMSSVIGSEKIAESKWVDHDTAKKMVEELVLNGWSDFDDEEDKNMIIEDLVSYLN